MKLFGFILALLIQLTSLAQENQIDSLKSVINTAEQDTTKLRAILTLDDLIYLSDPALDNELNLQIVEICETNLKRSVSYSDQEIDLYQEYLSNAYNVLGINQDDLGNYSEALDYYYKAIWISEQRNDLDKISSVYNNIGLIHERLDDFELALKYYRLSLSGVRNAGNKSGEINALNNIGSMKLAMGDLDSSLIYYKSALAIAKDHDFEYFYTATLANIGVSFERLDMKDSALYYYQLAKPKLEELGDWDGLSNIYFNIGTVYLEADEGRKAIEYCKKGYKIAVEYNGDYRKALNCSCLYSGYNQIGQADSALKYYILMDSTTYKFTNLETTKEIAQKELAYEHKKSVFADSLRHANEINIKDFESAKDRAQSNFRITLLLAGLGLIIGIWLFVYYRLRITKRQKLEIEKQESLTRSQKEIIENQKEEIEQSISYAQLIQQSTLPQKELKSIFPDSFLMYIPKDVVSGDFYWLEETKEEAYFSVADCTGHGIPGAFISMIGTILLNEIYNSKKLDSPDSILDELNRLIQMTLLSHNREMKDGMDISFCKLNKKTNELHYAGANNPVWIVSKEKTIAVDLGEGFEEINPNISDGNVHLFEIKADKQPVGRYHEIQKPFNLKKAQLKQGDAVYLFSDGYPDQFGGPDWKKFKYKPFKKMFLSIHEMTMVDQLDHINQVFFKWKGEVEQIDDVCVIGVKL